MFCKNCGNKIDDTKNFCINCGTPTANLSTQSTQSSKPPVRRLMPDEPWTTKKALKVLGVIAVVVFIVFSRIQNSADSTAIDKNNSALNAFETGNNTQAIDQFKDATSNAATNDVKISTLKNLAYAYDGNDQEELALSSFKEALKLTSKNSFDYYLVSGEIASLENNASAASVNFKRAFELEPDNFQINNSLAIFDMDVQGKHPEFQDYENALVYAQKAYSVSNLQIAKQNLGMAYYFNEKYNEAISTFGSITLDKDKLTAYWLGLSYAQNGDVSNAKIYLQKAINNGVEVPQEVYDYLNSH